MVKYYIWKDLQNDALSLSLSPLNNNAHTVRTWSVEEAPLDGQNQD